MICICELYYYESPPSMNINVADCWSNKRNEFFFAVRFESCAITFQCYPEESSPSASFYGLKHNARRRQGFGIFALLTVD